MLSIREQLPLKFTLFLNSEILFFHVLLSLKSGWCVGFTGSIFL